MAVALYARVSTTRQADNDLSIPDQLKQMREWCKGNGFAIGEEYIEAGASATDDRRPAFQQMIAEAMLLPPPFEAIVVHSQSRFFRDSIDFGLYERKLNKAGVKLISVTQPNGEDSSSGLIRRMISVFDEYQSRENSKHTLRAMKENARQGYFNGSRAPYGYRVVESEAIGNRGRKKKLLEISPSEAETIQRIYELYLYGLNGTDMGVKNIAEYLNSNHVTMRGNLWRKQKVHAILGDSVYMGEFVFNRRDPKKKGIKPEIEWIRVPVDPIIDEAIFFKTAARREARSPDNTPPRVVSSPTLLTGLLKCGRCGAAMTLATGKSGKYRYYKCNNRVSKSRHLCDSPNLPMEKTDEIILNQLAEKVFTPQRVEAMMAELRERLRETESAEDQQLKTLSNELRTLEARLNKLYEAVELDILPLDSTLQDRAHKLKAARETVLMQIAGLRRRKMLPLEHINPAKRKAFTKALQTRLKDPSCNFGKDYLRLLVDEIRVEGNQATVLGRYGAMASAVSGNQVPSFVPSWHARRDSNPLPSA